MLNLNAFLAPNESLYSPRSLLLSCPGSARLGKNLGIRNRIPFFSSLVRHSALTPSGESGHCVRKYDRRRRRRRRRPNDPIFSPTFLLPRRIAAERGRERRNGNSTQLPLKVSSRKCGGGRVMCWQVAGRRGARTKPK